MQKHEPAAVPPAIIAGVTLVIVLAFGWTVWRNTLHRPDIRGQWSSAGCETASTETSQPAFFKRTINLTRAEWKLMIDFFSDSGCVNKTMSLEKRGTYELGDKSAEVEGATHGEFGIASISLTPHTPETAQVFEQSRCGNTQWEVGTSREVGDTGCLSVAQKIADCPSEFDLVKRDNDLLYVGDRSESLCERGEWPKMLNPTPLKK